MKTLNTYYETKGYFEEFLKTNNLIDEKNLFIQVFSSDLNKNNLKHTPIVALTANALVTDRARFLGAGMDEFVSKPIDKETLIRALHRSL